MFDIEVIDNVRHAIIYPDSLTHRLLLGIRSAMIMQRLSSDSGEIEMIDYKSVVALSRDSFKRKKPVDDLDLLVHVGLLDTEVNYHSDHPYGHPARNMYKLTEAGRDLLAKLKDGAEEIMLPFPLRTRFSY